ncbi:hypothetical protein AJ79_09469 [Helicocarpus griseus UAMH5409]|uniref:Nudix hydrolase domain-containing protein n=1 Tax=Helicocarpus griseus UAMH5409 TaxID=1447875 RepID=A0A2B7WJQ6_9EURO|nr:hypothetical protein AJ79_09469 [Helicocarpus griseus UAMH5409]
MSETKMRLEDWLDDLCVRFIVNLPREELESVERICFQVEEAQWFYEDFIRPLDPNLPSLSLRAFALRIFQHCPLMSQWSHYHHSTAFSEFLAYKTRVPVRGAILLNQDMDEVVLVKGWKKNANWSFPRGKINKDEKDLDCAIREVYEETGFDIKAAGLVKDEKKIKYIEIPMREQNMRLYVLRGVPRDTHFEPRTRKEISKIEWYKLSDLPTLKKSKLVETDGHNLSNKFYMVAPFLVPLKKWIAQQKRADLTAANLSPHGITTDGLLVEEDEGLSGNDQLPKEPANEPQLPSDLPEVSTVEDPSAHLKRLLNISNGPSLPAVSAQNQPQLTNPDSSKGSALLALLRKGSEVTVNQTPLTTAAPSTQPMYPVNNVAQPVPYTAFPPQPSFTHTSTPPHQVVLPMTSGTAMPMNQAPYRNMPHPGEIGKRPSPPFPHSPGHPLHSHQQQPPQANMRHYPYPSFPNPPNGIFSRNQPSTLPNYPRQPFGMPTSSAPGQVPSFSANLPQRHAPAPYQRTGDPEFAQELHPNTQAPSVPPASKLPPPKLTSHSLALLNVFKNDSIKKADASRPELPSQTSGQHVLSKTSSHQQESLLQLLKKPQPVQAASASPPAPAELAARPSPSLDTAKIRVPGEPEQSQQTAQYEQRRSPNHAARTSATVSGPLNMPQFEAIAKSTSKKSATRSPRNMGKGEATPPKANVVILPRPASAKKEPPAPQSITQPSPPPPKRNVKLSELTKPFQPKILRRPVKDDLEASLPSGTVAVNSFSLSEKDATPEHPREPTTEVNYDRRPSQTASQKEALLSLFGKAPSPAPLSAKPTGAISPAPKSPSRSAVISPVDSSSPQVGASKGAPAPLSRSSVGSISPLAGSESKAAPTSPVNKAFLLGYLDQIAKGKQ